MTNKVIAEAIAGCKEVLIEEIAKSLKENGKKVRIDLPLGGELAEVVRDVRLYKGDVQVYTYLDYGCDEDEKEGVYSYIGDILTLDEIIKVIDEM